MQLTTIIHSKRLGEAIRFCVVGILATGIHYAIYYALLRYGTHASIAYTIGYALSFISNFYLSARFTFKKKTSVKKGIGFAMSHLLNYLLQIICLNIFIWLDVPAELSPIPVYCVCIPINFLLVRLIFNELQ